MAFLGNRLYQTRFLTPNLIRSIYLSPKSNVTLKPVPAAAPIEETHDAKNARLLRPQSPHLTIYAFQLTSMLSISHRFTGLALTAYTTGLGVGSLLLPIPDLLNTLSGLNPVLLFGLKATMAFPFAYHFANGIRHLIWDNGKFLTLQGVYSTGYTMLGISSLVTIILLSL